MRGLPAAGQLYAGDGDAAVGVGAYGPPRLGCCRGRVCAGRCAGDGDGQRAAAGARGDQGVVQVDDLAGVAVQGNAPAIDEDGPVAQGVHGGGRVRHEQQRGALLQEAADALKALLLEEDVAHGKCFVHDQDVGPHGGGHGKGQAHLHAAGVGAHGLVDVVANVCKGFDFGHLALQFLGGHACQQAGHVDVLAAGEVALEAHAQFQQRRYAPTQFDAACGGLHDASDELEQGAFARTVDADDAYGLARLDLKADVLQYPMGLVVYAHAHPFKDAG